MDYRKCLRIAEELEKALEVEAGIAEDIDERVENEKKDVAPVEPCLEASEDADDKEACRIARKKKLASLAKCLRESSVSEEKKKDMMARICRLAKEEGLVEEKTAAGLGVKRSDLNKPLAGDAARIMKQTGQLNKMVQEIKGEGLTLKEMVTEMKEMAEQTGQRMDFPTALINKTIGSCDAAWIIKLGPMVANLLKQYEAMKEASLEGNSETSAENE